MSSRGLRAAFVSCASVAFFCAARKPKSRDDIGPNSSNEAARLRARNEELERENRSLERENLALRNQVDELKQRLSNATGKAALPADDGLDIPACLRRSAGP